MSVHGGTDKWSSSHTHTLLAKLATGNIGIRKATSNLRTTPHFQFQSECVTEIHYRNSADVGRTSAVLTGGKHPLVNLHEHD